MLPSVLETGHGSLNPLYRGRRGEWLCAMWSLCSLSYPKFLQTNDTMYSFLKHSGCQMTGLGIKSLRSQMGLYGQLIRLFSQSFRNQLNALPNPLEINWEFAGNWWNFNSLPNSLEINLECMGNWLNSLANLLEIN